MCQIDQPDRQPARLRLHHPYRPGLTIGRRSKDRSPIDISSALRCFRKGGPRRQRLPAAVIAAVADRAVRLQRHMPDMRRLPLAPPLQPPVHNRPAANASADRDEHHVSRAAPCPMHPLAKRRRRTVMLQIGWHPDGRGDPVADRKVAKPVDGRRRLCNPAFGIQRPRRPDPRRHDAGAVMTH